MTSNFTWGAVGLIPKRGQVRYPPQRVRGQDLGYLTQTQNDPGNSWLPEPVGNLPLVKPQQ